MSYKPFALLLVGGLLAGCAGQLGGPPVQPAMSPHYSHSVGFTGLAAPVRGQAAYGAVAVGHGGAVKGGVVARRPTVVPGAPRKVVIGGAEVPVVAVKARGTNRSQHARVAIGKAGVAAPEAQRIMVAGQALWFSLVEVGTTRFAVLKKKPRLLDATMRTGTRTAFVSKLPGLTGCTADGAGYGLGANRAVPTAIAVPLNCG